MDWKFLIIPLIPLAIWIVWNIFRASEDQKEQERLREQRRQRSADRPAPAPAPALRKQANDLDRFLSDARSRRSGSRAHRDAPPKALRDQPAPVAPVAQLPEELPRAVPVVPKPTPRTDPPPRPTPTAKPAFVPLPVAPTPQPDPVPMRAADLPTVEPARVVRQPMSPLVLRLRALMRDRDSLRAAMALQEILDRPVSQRRR